MTTPNQYDEQEKRRKKAQEAARGLRLAQTQTQDRERGNQASAARAQAQADTYQNTTRPYVTMQQAYDAEYGKPRFGSGVPGGSERQARQSILDLRRRFAGTSGAFGQQIRSLRAGEAEAAEQYGSAMAQRAGGMSGGLRQRGFENLMNQYRAQQAGVGAQRRGAQADLFKDVSSVRNLLDQQKFEAAVERAGAVSRYWNSVLEKGRQLSPEALELIEKYGMGGAQ